MWKFHRTVKNEQGYPIDVEWIWTGEGVPDGPPGVGTTEDLSVQHDDFKAIAAVNSIHGGYLEPDGDKLHYVQPQTFSRSPEFLVLEKVGEALERIRDHLWLRGSQPEDGIVKSVGDARDALEEAKDV